MTPENPKPVSEIPKENISRGIWQVEIPELGEPDIRGKVRDIWVVCKENKQFRVTVTTDRTSVFDERVCTVPGKGQILNLMSAFWFEKTKDIFPNHMIAVPHPNVLIAKQAKETLPVEIILRRYMAKSSSSTSIYYNYVDLGRREIYGIKFPEGLKANQEFPMGIILTPTTKAEGGQHDQELTDEQARRIVDNKLGNGIWEKVKTTAISLFKVASDYCLKKDLILADTKYEFGIDNKGDPMVIDELFTSDSSRFWLAKTYDERFKEGETPDTYDKEILRVWMASYGFKGKGTPIPKVDPKIVDRMAEAYTVPYEKITGKKLPPATSDPNLIREAIDKYFT